MGLFNFFKKKKQEYKLVDTPYVSQHEELQLIENNVTPAMETHVRKISYTDIYDKMYGMQLTSSANTSHYSEGLQQAQDLTYINTELIEDSFEDENDFEEIDIKALLEDDYVENNSNWSDPDKVSMCQPCDCIDGQCNKYNVDEHLSIDKLVNPFEPNGYDIPIGVNVTYPDTIIISDPGTPSTFYSEPTFSSEPTTIGYSTDDSFSATTDSVSMDISWSNND